MGPIFGYMFATAKELHVLYNLIEGCVTSLNYSPRVTGIFGVSRAPKVIQTYFVTLFNVKRVNIEKNKMIQMISDEERK